MGVTATANHVGRRAERSGSLHHAVQLGLVAYGVVHLLIGWLALRLALSGHSNPSSQTALDKLAQSTGGQVILLVVAAGFFALVLWQLVEAIGGNRRSSGAKRLLKRAVALGKVVIYGALGVTALQLGLGSGSKSSGGTKTYVARLFGMPGGQTLVAVIGGGIIVTALVLAYYGISGRFTKKLTPRGKQGSLGSAIIWSGRIGYVGKAIALGAIGALFLWSASTHNARKSGGLDQALHQLLREPFGSGIVVVVAIGIACFGVFCFGWARHLDT